MIPAFEMLNKIKWDKRESPSLCTIHIYDRILKKNIEIKYTDIKEIGKAFMTVQRNGEIAEIPLHRIREIRKNNKTLWKRNA